MFKPYPQYKESGTHWLGPVPNHWIELPGLAVLSEKQKKNTGLREKRVLSLSYGKIVIKAIEKLHGLVPESFETYQIVGPGDIIIRSTDLQNDKVSLRVGEVKDIGIITSAYLCLKPKNGLTARYAYLVLHGFDLMKVFYGLGSGLRQNLSWIDFKRLPFFIPPSEEQEQIAQYLDWKTTQIAKFIKAKKRLIELLKEQKHVIINDVVTGKIDVRTGKPYPKYKVSGVLDVGKIPEEWEVKRVKDLFKNLNKSRVPLSSTERGKMKLRLYDYYGASGKIDKVDDFIYDDELILIAEDGANLVYRNLPLLIIAQGKFWVNNHAHILKPLEGNIRFLANLLESKNYLPWISGAAQPKLTQDRLMSIRFPVPKSHEQDLIQNFIVKATAPIELSVLVIQKEIDLLKEYRTRLIADVVTGKVDVRDIRVLEIKEEDVLPDLEEPSDVEEILDDTTIDNDL